MADRISWSAVSCSVKRQQSAGYLLTDDDRALFLELLQEFSERFNIAVYAFVLMGNHSYKDINNIGESGA